LSLGPSHRISRRLRRRGPPAGSRPPLHFQLQRFLGTNLFRLGVGFRPTHRIGRRLGFSPLRRQGPSFLLGPLRRPSLSFALSAFRFPGLGFPLGAGLFGSFLGQGFLFGKVILVHVFCRASSVPRGLLTGSSRRRLNEGVCPRLLGRRLSAGPIRRLSRSRVRIRRRLGARRSSRAGP